MKKTDALKYFEGAPNVAKILGLTVHAIYQWPEKVPERCQWQLALMSDLDLMPDKKLIPSGLNVKLLKNESSGKSKRVSELMQLANIIEKQGKTNVLDALIKMAKHNS